jgi:hypothetical protein
VPPENCRVVVPRWPARPGCSIVRMHCCRPVSHESAAAPDAMRAVVNSVCTFCRRWDTGHGQSWDNSMAAMSMFSMADLPSVRDAQVRRSKAGARNSRPRSAAEISGFAGATASAIPDMVQDVAMMKAKTDRIEAMLQQARIEGVQVAGDMRTVIREEVQRQLRSSSVSARSTKTPDGRQSRTRTTFARRSSAGLSSSSRHSHAARRRQVSYNAQCDCECWESQMTAPARCVETVV